MQETSYTRDKTLITKGLLSVLSKYILALSLFVVFVSNTYAESIVAPISSGPAKNSLYCVILPHISILAKSSCDIVHVKTFEDLQSNTSNNSIILSRTIAREFGVVGAGVSLIGGATPAKFIPRLFSQPSYKTKNIT